MPVSSLKPHIPKFRPLGNRLVVHRLDGPKEVGGIILPESQIKVGLVQARVVLIGSKVEPHHHIKVGDIVHLPPQLGYMKFIMDGLPVDIVPVDQIYGVEAA